MKKAILYFTFIVFALPVIAGEVTKTIKGSEEYQIGVMVKSISEALESPDKAAAMKTITKYGTDSRYYVMIRGWLVQALKGVDSQLDATRDKAKKESLREKRDWLYESIRRIDLE